MAWPSYPSLMPSNTGQPASRLGFTMPISPVPMLAVPLSPQTALAYPKVLTREPGTSSRYAPDAPLPPMLYCMLTETPASAHSTPMACNWLVVLEPFGERTILFQSYGPPDPLPPRKFRLCVTSVT